MSILNNTFCASPGNSGKQNKTKQKINLWTQAGGIELGKGG